MEAVHRCYRTSILTTFAFRSITGTSSASCPNLKIIPIYNWFEFIRLLSIRPRNSTKLATTIYQTRATGTREMTQVLASSAESPLSLLEQKTVPKTSRNYRRQTTSEPSFQQFPRNGIKSVRSINYYLLSCAREQIEIMQKGGNNNFVENTGMID